MKPGPKPRYTLEQQRAITAKICKRISKGQRIGFASEKEGVLRQRLYEWMAADEQIRLMVKCAHADSFDIHQRRLDGLIDTDAGSARVQLQQMTYMFPDEFEPPKQRVEQSGTTAQQLVVRLDGVKDLQRLKSEARAALAARTHEQETEGDDDD